MSDFLFKERDGQTPPPHELQKGLKIKTIQTVGIGRTVLSHRESADYVR